MIYLLTSCNTEERIAQNIYIHNSNRNIKKKNQLHEQLTTRTILEYYPALYPALQMNYSIYNILIKIERPTIFKKSKTDV